MNRKIKQIKFRTGCSEGGAAGWWREFWAMLNGIFRKSFPRTSPFCKVLEQGKGNGAGKGAAVCLAGTKHALEEQGRAHTARQESTVYSLGGVCAEVD